MKKNIQTLLQKEMTRKEFLGVVGLGVASIFGLSSIIRMLSGNNSGATMGYGSSSYGGKR